MRGHSEAFKDVFDVSDNVHGISSAASAKSQLD